MLSISLVCNNGIGWSQEKDWSFSIESLIQVPKAKRAIVSDTVWTRLSQMRLKEKRSYLMQLSKGRSHSNKELAARCKLIWARLQPFDSCSIALKLLKEAESAALQQNDNLLLAESYYALGETYARCGPNEQALLFFTRSLILRQGLGLQFFSDNPRLFYQMGGLFFRLEQYRDAIYYMQLGLLDSDNPIPLRSRLNAMHVSGLSYLELQHLDSAAYWMTQCRQLAHQANDSAWIGISYGNHALLSLRRGAIADAKTGFFSDYHIALITGDSTRAGAMLHNVAGIYQAAGAKDSALWAAQRAFSLVWQHRAYPNAQQRLQTLNTLRKTLASNGRYVEAYNLEAPFQVLKDSIQLAKTNSQRDWVSTYLQWEKAESDKKNLLLQNAAERRLRWFLMATILLVLLAAWLFYKHRTEQQRNLMQQLRHEKLLMEQEALAAKKELDLVVQTHLERSALVEQMVQLQPPAQAPLIASDLLHHTILTDLDWVRFKELFEKVYPDFLVRLKKAFPEISPAELRLATLLKLGVGNKHLASMLGLSPDSVRKSKSRLRQKLPLQPGEELEMWVAAI